MPLLCLPVTSDYNRQHDEIDARASKIHLSRIHQDKVVGVCQRKSLQTSFTKDNPRTQTKNNIGRSPRDAGDAPEGLGEHDSQIEKDNRSQGQTF